MTPRVSPKENYGLQLTILLHFRFTFPKKKKYHPVSDVDNGEGYACGGQWDRRNLSVCFNFIVNLKLLFSRGTWVQSLAGELRFHMLGCN